MNASSYAHWMLDQEARALLARLARVKPFVLTEPMLLAASLLPAAQIAIERFLAKGRRELKERVQGFLGWLHGEGAASLRRRTSSAGSFFSGCGSTLCFAARPLQSGHYPAERERTGRLAVWSRRRRGGRLGAAGILRSPACDLLSGSGRRRGDQARADPSAGRRRKSGRHDSRPARADDRQRHRIIPDPRSGSSRGGPARIGSLAAAGSASQATAMPASLWCGVCGSGGSPKSFPIFGPLLGWAWCRRLGSSALSACRGRLSSGLNVDDPHPTPWIRVKLSCAIGDGLYPHPQWRRVAELWESYYPVADLDDERRNLLARLEESFPEFVATLINHRPKALRGRSLREAMNVEQRTPSRLTALFGAWSKAPEQMYRAPPSLVFAVLGQAKADGSLSPEDESDLLAKLLTFWAMRSTLDSFGVLRGNTKIASASVST